MSVKFNITGFKPFHGVASNPTEILLNQLKEESQKMENIEFNHLDTIDVSMKSARQYYHDHSKDNIDLFLHMGVAADSKTFRLERFAYNKADFRAPDNEG